MDEPKAASEEPSRATFEQSVLLRLDELDRKIERVLTLACPVCGPDVIAQIHPDATKVLASNNGKGHGR